MKSADRFTVLKYMGVAVLLSVLGVWQTASAQEQLFQGVATTNVQLFDVFGQARGTFTYQVQALVVLGSPISGGGLTEANPFHLAVDPIQIVNAPGELSIRSAALSNGFMFQYWQFQLINQNSWQGNLVNNHAAESIALNILTVPQEIAPHIEIPTSMAMANNTQMVGEVSGNQVTIVVDGNSIGGTTPFHTEIVAQRVQ